jgi:hypothetical protein
MRIALIGYRGHRVRTDTAPDKLITGNGYPVRVHGVVQVGLRLRLGSGILPLKEPGSRVRTARPNLLCKSPSCSRYVVGEHRRSRCNLVIPRALRRLWRLLRARLRRSPARYAGWPNRGRYRSGVCNRTRTGVKSQRLLEVDPLNSVKEMRLVRTGVGLGTGRKLARYFKDLMRQRQFKLGISIENSIIDRHLRGVRIHVSDRFRLLASMLTRCALS